MSTICAEQQHKLHSTNHHQHQQQPLLNKKPCSSFKDHLVEIPPRKQQQQLLNHHLNKKFTHLQDPISTTTTTDNNITMHVFPDELLHHQKYLPFNNSDHADTDNDADPYASDHFRMYEFKIRRCTRSRSHDWTDCPFAHPGEKARRRDPRRYHYSGTVCSDFRRGCCSRGDDCEFAHGVFECWLHPSRYRTEACKDGKSCKRKVCFFAHTPRQLRILPEIAEVNNANEKNKHRNNPFARSCDSLNNQSHCCLFCHSQLTSSSPTSTLFGMSHLSPPLSPSLSPPLSPVSQRSVNGFSPISRYNFDHRLGKFGNNSGLAGYKDVLTELMTSLEAVNFNEVSSPMSPNVNDVLWVDVNFNGDQDQQHQQQFILSPSTPSGASRNFFNGDCSSNIDKKVSANDKVDGGLLATSSPDPDLGWVNDLLM